MTWGQPQEGGTNLPGQAGSRVLKGLNRGLMKFDLRSLGAFVFAFVSDCLKSIVYSRVHLGCIVHWALTNV